MVYAAYMAFSANNPNDRRCTMKVSQAVDLHLQYYRANSKKKYRQNLCVRPQSLLIKIWQA